MGRYGQTGIRAVDSIRTGKEKNPIDVWKFATCQIFGKGVLLYYERWFKLWYIYYLSEERWWHFASL